MDQWTDASWNRYFGLNYRCRLGALYHRKRERFFSSCDKWSTAITLIAGSAAFSRFVTEEIFALLVGLTVVAASMLKLVMGWSDKARTHAVLAQRFIQLDATMVAAGPMDAEKLDQFESELIAIDADEPPALSALVRQCQNELDQALGKHSPENSLGFWRRFFCHLFDMPKTA